MNNSSPIYNSRIIDNYIEYLKKELPDVDVDELLRYAGIEQYEIIDEGHWLTQKQVNRFHEKLYEVTGDPDISYKVGQSSVHSKVAGNMKRYVLKFITPQKAFAAIDTLYSKWSKGHIASSRIIGENCIEVIISTKKGVREEPFQCRNRTGTVEAVSMLFNEEVAKVDHPECMHRNADHCRYVITLNEKKSVRLKRYVVWMSSLSFLITAGSFAFMDVYAGSAIALGAVFLNLILYFHATRIEIRELNKKVEHQGEAAEKYVEETRLRYNHAMLIQDIGKAGTSILDIRRFISAAVKSMAVHLDFKRCIVFLSGNQGRTLNFAGGNGISNQQKALIRNKEIRVDFALTSDPFVTCIKERKPFLTNDFAACDEHLSGISRALAKGFHVKSIISAPIIYRGSLLGLLLVDSPEPERSLTKSDLGLVSGLASQIAAGIINARSIKKIKESERKYRLLAENITDIIWILDVETLSFKYISPSYERSFGYTVKEAMKMPLEKMLPPASFALAVETLGDALRQIEEKKETPSQIIRTFEIEQYAKNGEVIPIEISACGLMDASGKPVSILGTTRDISRRKKAEIDRRALEEKLRQSKKMESLGVMAGSIAHNFNNLLMVVLGNLEIAALDLRGNMDALSNVNAAAKAATRASDLSTMMLTYVGQLKKDDEHVDLKHLVIEVVAALKDPSPESPEIMMDLTEDTVVINADPKQIRQVVMGLVTNGVEAIESDNGCITVSVKSVYCDKAALSTTYLKDDLPEGIYSCIEITDNGCGMDAETLQKIFDPYFSTKFTGRGLGLAAALGIIRSHNGAITVNSRPGAGSTFLVMFPQIDFTKKKMTYKMTELTHQKDKNTILLVDDEALVIDIGKQLIARLGFNVITAEDGREAIDIYHVRKDEIACILLDLTMPVMDGIETFGRLKKMDDNVKVIITSGYTQQQIADHFEKDNPPAGCIQKPFSIENLKDKLLSVM